MKKFNLNRRDFLFKASAILAASQIPLHLQKRILQNFGNLIVTPAEAATPPVYWVVEIPCRASICFGNWFPGPGMLASPFWNQTGYPGFTGDKDRVARVGNMFVAEEAADLAPHVGNIANFECMFEQDIDHTSLWALRCGFKTVGPGGFLNPESGLFNNEGELRASPILQTLPACLTALFAGTVGSRRNPETPLKGVNMGYLSETRFTHLLNRYPKLDNINNFDEISRFLKTILTETPSAGPSLKRTDMSATLAAIKAINKLQEAQQLALRYDNTSQTRSIAEDGLNFLDRLLSDSPPIQPPIQTGPPRNSPEEIAQLRAEFLTGVRTHYEGPSDFGEDLMTAYLGFRENVFSSAAICLDMGHCHLVEDWNPEEKNKAIVTALGELRDNDRYMTQRLARFINRLKITPSPIGGGSMFDHTLIVISSEHGKMISYHDVDDVLNWGHDERYGGVLIGGGVRGGYYGDILLEDIRKRDMRRTFGFDFNSGTVVPESRPKANSVYRTIAELAGISDADIRETMGKYYDGSQSINIWKS